MSIRAEDEPQRSLLSLHNACLSPMHARPPCALFYNNFACTPNKEQMIVRFITFACQTAGLKIGKWTARGASVMPTFFAGGTNFHFASLTHSHTRTLRRLVWHTALFLSLQIHSLSLHYKVFLVCNSLFSSIIYLVA
jgi:hypothetical protein